MNSLFAVVIQTNQTNSYRTYNKRAQRTASGNLQPGRRRRTSRKNRTIREYERLWTSRTVSEHPSSVRRRAFSASCTDPISRLVPLHRRTFEHPSGIDNSVDCSRTIQTSETFRLHSKVSSFWIRALTGTPPERTKIVTTPNQPESSIALEVHTGSPSRWAALRRHHRQSVSTRVSLSRKFMGFLGQGPWGEVIGWCIANSEIDFDTCLCMLCWLLLLQHWVMFVNKMFCLQKRDVISVPI